MYVCHILNALKRFFSGSFFAVAAAECMYVILLAFGCWLCAHFLLVYIFGQWCTYLIRLFHIFATILLVCSWNFLSLLFKKKTRGKNIIEFGWRKKTIVKELERKAKKWRKIDVTGEKSQKKNHIESEKYPPENDSFLCVFVTDERFIHVYGEHMH